MLLPIMCTGNTWQAPLNEPATRLAIVLCCRLLRRLLQTRASLWISRWLLTRRCGHGILCGLTCGTDAPLCRGQQHCTQHLLTAALALHGTSAAPGARLSTACRCCLWLVFLCGALLCCLVCSQECDDLVELQVAARVARVREVELAAARQEAAAK
jgi:hypothetical protein